MDKNISGHKRYRNGHKWFIPEPFVSIGTYRVPRNRTQLLTEWHGYAFPQISVNLGTGVLVDPLIAEGHAHPLPSVGHQSRLRATRMSRVQPGNASAGPKRLQPHALESAVSPYKEFSHPGPRIII